jgi:endonuclease/exonuclease/phosphatase family metal-dependent hydrolase
LWKYLQINKDKLNESILIGDFNSNTVWDQWDRWWNHSDVVNELKEIGIESFYHKFTNELHGKESKPTLHFQKKLTRPYHIDYIFGSQKFTDKIINFEIGEFDNWIGISDHMPVICEIYY